MLSGGVIPREADLQEMAMISHFIGHSESFSRHGWHNAFSPAQNIVALTDVNMIKFNENSTNTLVYLPLSLHGYNPG